MKSLSGIFSIVVGTLALSACSKPADTAAPEPTALIKTAAVSTGVIEQTMTLYGAAENGAIGKYTISSPVEALVRSIETPVGNNVGRGQVIVRLVPSPSARLDLANAAANANSANLAYDRARRLRADGLLSDAEVESARAAKQIADAARASLAGRAGALVLRAPGSGTVEMIGASAGELVAAGTALVTIAKDGPLRARFGIDPALARRIPAGSSIRITAAGSAPPITVPVLSVDSVVDPQTKLASVYVSIPDASEIGAGESLTGQISLGISGGGITIPYAALLDDGGQPFVFVIEKSVAKRRDIMAGAKMGDRIGVSSGLKAGEIVAIDGVTALEDGVKVRTK